VRRIMEHCTDATCEIPTTEKGGLRLCPRCGFKSKRVSTTTVRYMVRGIFQGEVDDDGSYRFCQSPLCPVVYFAEGQLFTKDQLSERVTIKETEDPIPVCYCFNFTRKDLEKEIREKGRTTIPDFISRQVKAENCFCEYTNPEGTCCLGNVNRISNDFIKKEVSK